MMHLPLLAPVRLHRARAHSSKLSMLAAATLAVSAAFGPVLAGQTQEIAVVIKNHAFEPAQIVVPAAKAITLKVRNLDATAEEFESKALGFEKVIAGGASATIRLKPLAKGRYSFVGEFHEDTAKGTIIAE